MADYAPTLYPPPRPGINEVFDVTPNLLTYNKTWPPHACYFWERTYRDPECPTAFFWTKFRFSASAKVIYGGSSSTGEGGGWINNSWIFDENGEQVVHLLTQHATYQFPDILALPKPGQETIFLDQQQQTNQAYVYWNQYDERDTGEESGLAHCLVRAIYFYQNGFHPTMDVPMDTAYNCWVYDCWVYAMRHIGTFYNGIIPFLPGIPGIIGGIIAAAGGGQTPNRDSAALQSIFLRILHNQASRQRRKRDERER